MSAGFEQQAGANYLRQTLPKVSRSFALTIPQLPAPLDHAVATAYLLCRVADTIEDEPHLDADGKRRLHELLPQVCTDAAAAEAFAAAAADTLSVATPLAERDLVANTPLVAQAARALPEADRRAVAACLTAMCDGMQSYLQRPSGLGLDNLADLDRYCYFVAGVVGEMLTELFCNYDPQMDRRRGEMQRLAPSFGQGLQMTNILKDVWDDLDEGRCWLPRDELARAGGDIRTLSSRGDRRAFDTVLADLVGVAHGHLRNALRYTLEIPARQPGIRQFCFYSVGLALLTLQRIQRTAGYDGGSAVKVTRRQVASVIAASRMTSRVDSGLKLVFRVCARGLPLRPVQPWRVPG